MVTELQFVAVAAFLIWGLASSLCGLLKPEVDDTELVQNRRQSPGAGQLNSNGGVVEPRVVAPVELRASVPVGRLSGVVDDRREFAEVVGEPRRIERPYDAAQVASGVAKRVGRPSGS